MPDELKVASFGDYFADKRKIPEFVIAPKSVDVQAPIWSIKEDISGPKVEGAKSIPLAKKVKTLTRHKDQPVQCLIYKDPFANVYKK